ncbi:D-hexose-6-phosphate mutarotase [Alkalitalea saponilacus]|uniref:Putative glucose-6-phosphate 1-epimerase n=1 Tax=Alkalitalea saponilacus TaxID=889453 RepID=A0A1T5BRS5_9BACT|nr:D-hexose-6-phosphate mutarotase [Alkalitalea saponilacus]ASB49619.1 D-hexose-6-phosphate mutarotase [Alkalitalea saponilacus]SKB49895.1 glucose-6-phosphate 1-epimerase [Alkalitalea saponilacus]
MTIDELNQKRGIKDRLQFSEENGMPVATITNNLCTCKISIYGAQVLSFIPANSKNLIWVSEAAVYEPGVAIRGGIPLCFPWFGPHEENNTFPKHGFARLLFWNVDTTEQLISGETKISLSLTDNDYTQQYFPFSFKCTLEITAGKELMMKWTTLNNSKESFKVSNALHTYFNVGNIHEVSISGLENLPFMEEIRSDDPFSGESSPLKFTRETDRTYTDTTNSCKIRDPSLKRSILMKKSGSNSTVVWNPWAELSNKMQDLKSDDFNQFVCVEAANVLHNAVFIEPGEEHCMTMVVEEEENG